MHLYVVVLSYRVPIEKIMEAAPDHRIHLQPYYADQSILFSGIQCSQAGGVIVMRAENEAFVREMIAGDPFYLRELATYDIVCFDAKKAQPYINEWIHGN